MHYGRIVALVGVVVGVIGFVLKSASSAGEEALPALSQASPDFPSGFDNTWTALYNDTAWAAIVFALAMIAVLILIFMPPLKGSMNRMYSLVASVLGVAMIAIGVVATMGAGDDADTLEAGFAQAAAGGAIPQPFTVSIGVGWYLLIAAGALVAIGGVLSLMATSDS